MRTWLLCAAVHGFLAVALGAFAAHGLQDTLEQAQLEWIETGARYQLSHALALLGVAALANVTQMADRKALKLAGVAFAVGALLFPGGLYLAAIFGWTWLIPVVPVGGVAFLVGWLALAVLALMWKQRKANLSEA